MIEQDDILPDAFNDSLDNLKHFSSYDLENSNISEMFNIIDEVVSDLSTIIKSCGSIHESKRTIYGPEGILNLDEAYWGIYIDQPGKKIIVRLKPDTIYIDIFDEYNKGLTVTNLYRNKKFLDCYGLPVTMTPSAADWANSSPIYEPLLDLNDEQIIINFTRTLQKAIKEILSFINTEKLI